MDVYVITYDISDDKRRTKIAEALEGYGTRLQFSVFWCELSAPQLARLKAALDPLLDEGTDQVLFLHLGPGDGRAPKSVTWLGAAFRPPPRGAIIA